MFKGQLTGFQLKIVALIGMVLDHVTTHFGSILGFPFWVSWLGRFVAPLFLFLLMEGFRYTSNRKAYFFRLLAGAGSMLIITLLHNGIIGNYRNPLTQEIGLWFLLNGNNIFLTLACFFLLFYLIEKIKKGEGVWFRLLLLAPLILVTLVTEGGVYLMPLGLILAFFPGSKRVAILMLGISSFFLGIKAILNYSILAEVYPNLWTYLAYDNQWMQVLAIPLLAAYNGQRGGHGRPWEKYLFYIVYPLHLSIIYVLEFFFL